MSNQLHFTTGHLKTTNARSVGAILLFTLIAALIVSRRSDVLWNAQFHAEDVKFFAEAYNNGWLHVLLAPYSGYLVVFERLAGGLSLLAPLRFAPLAMNLIGLTAQALPVSFLLSSRCANWGSFPMRVAMSAAYIALPSGAEIHVTVTNAQWHLALLSCLIVLAAPSTTRGWVVFDTGVVLVSGLTGPYCLLLVPAAAIFGWKRRERWRSAPYVALAVAALMQVTTMGVLDAMNAPAAIGGRVVYPNGASGPLLVRIFGGGVFLNAIVGANKLAARAQPRYLLWCALLGAVGVAVWVYVLAKAPLALRLFVIFSLLVFGSCLLHPLMSVTVPQWVALANASDCRYYFLPMLAFVWSLIWAAMASKWTAMRLPAAALLVIFCLKMPKTWRYPLDPDLHFGEYVRRFEEAAPGTVVRVAVYPGDWVVYLKKH